MKQFLLPCLAVAAIAATTVNAEVTLESTFAQFEARTFVIDNVDTIVQESDLESTTDLGALFEASVERIADTTPGGGTATSTMSGFVDNTSGNGGVCLNGQTQHAASARSCGTCTQDALGSALGDSIHFVVLEVEVTGEPATLVWQSTVSTDIPQATIPFGSGQTNSSISVSSNLLGQEGGAIVTCAEDSTTCDGTETLQITLPIGLHRIDINSLVEARENGAIGFTPTTSSTTYTSTWTLNVGGDCAVPEGVVDGEGIAEGEGTVEGEGAVDGEGVADGEGIVEGEGVAEGSDDGEDEGEGETEGIEEGDDDGEEEGEDEGDVEGAEEGAVDPFFPFDCSGCEGYGEKSVGDLLLLLFTGLLCAGLYRPLTR